MRTPSSLTLAVASGSVVLGTTDRGAPVSICHGHTGNGEVETPGLARMPCIRGAHTAPWSAGTGRVPGDQPGAW